MKGVMTSHRIPERAFMIGCVFLGGYLLSSERF
jgi:hypothetical protein